MIRDIEERLDELGTMVEVLPVALTMDQVNQHRLPPNPAKFSDTRAPLYVAMYGRQSWELDALPPDVLSKLVEDAIREHIDIDKYNEVVEKEEADKSDLQEFIDTHN